jgi:hypothetical protein
MIQKLWKKRYDNELVNGSDEWKVIIGTALRTTYYTETKAHFQVNMRGRCAKVDKETNIEVQDVVASYVEDRKTMGN